METSAPPMPFDPQGLVALDSHPSIRLHGFRHSHILSPQSLVSSVWSLWD
jgi:hypothetical protein